MQRFQQPPGKPSRVSSFVSMIKLSQILGYALRTIVGPFRIILRFLQFTTDCQYANKRSKVIRGYVGPHWEEKTVSQLNSALNQWLDTLPQHRTGIILCCRNRPNHNASPMEDRPARHDMVPTVHPAALFLLYHSDDGSSSLSTSKRSTAWIAASGSRRCWREIS